MKYGIDHHHLRYYLISSLLIICFSTKDTSPLIAQVVDQKVLKVATLASRSGRAAREAKRAIKKVYRDSDGRVKVRIYWNGSAGDEETVLRKMRAGQIDGTFLGVSILRHIVPMSMIMVAPSTYTNYRQVAAVRKELSAEFEGVAWKNGFKIFNWIDIGKTRIFSSEPIKKPHDILKMRAWLYKHSPLLKEFYRLIGVTGVPIGLTGVYSALQTGIINLVWASCFTASILRWTSKMSYISPPVGILQGAFVIRKQFWESLKKEDRAALANMSKDNANSIQSELRRSDENSFRRLQKRGVKVVDFTRVDLWDAVSKRLRDKMVGRLYSRKLLTRVEKIVKMYPDQPSDRISPR